MRNLLLLGAGLALLVVAFLVLRPAADGLATDLGDDPGPSPSVGVGSASVVDTGTEPKQTGSGVVSSGDPLASLVSEACSQFRAGATVAEFSAWFQADVGTVDDSSAELFRAALTMALTQECPEVIPGN